MPRGTLGLCAAAPSRYHWPLVLEGFVRIDVVDSDDLEKHLSNPQRPQFVSLGSFANEVYKQDAVGRDRNPTKPRSGSAGLLDFTESLGRLVSDLQAGTLVAYVHHPDTDDLLAVDVSYWRAKANALTDRKFGLFLGHDSSEDLLNGRELVLKRTDAINWLRAKPGQTVIIVEQSSPAEKPKRLKKKMDPKSRYDRLSKKGKQCVDWAIELLRQRGGITPGNRLKDYKEAVEALAISEWEDDHPGETSIKRHVRHALEFLDLEEDSS